MPYLPFFYSVNLNTHIVAKNIPLWQKWEEKKWKWYQLRNQSLINGHHWKIFKRKVFKNRNKEKECIYPEMKEKRRKNWDLKNFNSFQKEFFSSVCKRADSLQIETKWMLSKRKRHSIFYMRLRMNETLLQQQLLLLLLLLVLYYKCRF